MEKVELDSYQSLMIRFLGNSSGATVRRDCIKIRLRLGVTYEKGVTLGNVTMSHRTRERPAECLASLSHSYDRSAARALENYA
ncbi:hypothetical protein EVAR_93591_1 [Eumeta japonica]|uniref:Uncharacterized protein n=1 Tax=Eumeta variegata TaxID=151549 RepID=A0A4C1TQG9_EUMVA|nr:hypothetical protein EVAR_93591_1 [Eumeta japonica]